MTYGVATNDRGPAERVFKVLDDNLDPVSKTKKISRDDLFVSDGRNCVRWVRPLESARGYKFDKVYVDVTTNVDFAMNNVLVMAWRHRYDDVVWVVDKQTILCSCFIESFHPSLKLIDAHEDTKLDFYQLKRE